MTEFAPTRDRFLDPLAMISLIVFALGVIGSVPLIAAVAWLRTLDWTPATTLMDVHSPITLFATLMHDGGVLQWLAGNALALCVLQLLGCVFGCIASWGLRQRWPWSRQAFIWMLGIGGLLNFSSLWPLDAMFTQFTGMIFAEADAEHAAGALAQMQAQRFMSMGTAFLGCVVLGAMHLWLMIKLMSPAVAAKFQR